jgi:4-hydroxybenzoate polyprenyltransferase
VVDLDRDILRSDVHTEAVLAQAKGNPLLALRLLRWRVTGGRMPESLSGQVPFKPSGLLYHEANLKALAEMAASGQRFAATSRLPSAWAEAILAHLSLFTGLTAPGQAATVALAEAEKPAWGGFARHIFKAMRPHQWSKNILVFVPLLLAHRVGDTQAVLSALIAFVCFSLTASSIYLLNDMLDLTQDRAHPAKRKRPFASGRLPLMAGVLMLPLSMGGAFWLAASLPSGFATVLALYVVMNLSYVFYLKSKLLVDVLALASAYTLRILGGERAIDVDLSFWLLAFSTFLFLSLALVKRYVELDTVEDESGGDKKRVMGRGYRRTDLDMLSQLGVASGFSAVLVLALYVDGAGRLGLYKTPEFIWLVCPIVLYVIGRIWVLAKRRELPDDPVLFIITDWRSHLMGAIVLAIMVAAKTVGYSL